MHPMLNVAIKAIRKAGNFLVKQYEFLDRKNLQSSSDYIEIFTSKIHAESDRIITKIIKKFYPLHSIDIYNTRILSDKNQDNTTHWIIESIDSNINFTKQFPFFALSIAVQHKKQIEIGVIYDPIHNELFSACRGKGAQFNEHRIRLDNNIFKHLNKIILAVSCSHIKYDIIFNILNQLHKKYTMIDFRHTGSIILDLAYVAIGRVDGCFIISLKNFNKLASGLLIIQESGGLITDFKGNGISNYRCSENIIAGNPKLIKSLLSLTKVL